MGNEQMTNKTVSKLSILYYGKEYREVKNFPNYFVAEDGSVFSWKTHRLLDPYKISSGHFMVKLRNGSEKPKNCYIHRLVAEAWISNPENLPIIHHKDSDITNNLASNLVWVSEEDHKATMPYYGKSKKRIVYEGVVYESFKDLADAFGVSVKTTYNWRDCGKVTFA